MVSEADEAAKCIGRGLVGRVTLLLSARVGVGVDRGQARAPLHKAVEVERDPIGGRADFNARDVAVPAERFDFVRLEIEMES